MTPNQRIALSLAVALAVPAEGLRQYAYYDPPGILTVCRGHTGPDVVKGKKYSLEECDRFMSDDMRQAVVTVDRCQPGLPPQVLAAFSDAVFNMGPKIACDPKASTAARLLAQARATNGDFSPACRQLPRWDKANVKGFMVSLPGLSNRRQAEMTLCLDSDAAA
jgi:GH24 family phage-related lysozyme (muramidase)